MRALKSDPQELRAYNWETDLFGWAGAKATRKEIRAAIRRCCKLYRVPTPKIRFLSKDRRGGRKLISYYDPNKHLIVLRPRHVELCTATHEAAHAIADWVLGNVSQLHGREWLGIHMVLLARQRLLPLSTLQSHARRQRLKFHPPHKTSPENIRKHFSSKVRLACRERIQARR